MSSASQVQVRYVEETTLGDGGGVSPTLTNLRVTSESLAHAQESVTSQELRADRQIPDLVRTSVSAQGGVNIEFSYEEFEPAILALLATPGFSTLLDVVGNTSIGVGNPVAGIQTMTGTTNVFANAEVGGWIAIRGFTDSNNNGVKKIVAKPDDNTLDLQNPAGSLEASGNSIDVKGQVAKVGTTRRSWMVEKEFVDVGEFHSFNGMVPSQFNLEVAVGAIVNGSLTFVGFRALQDTATRGDGSPIASKTNEVVNAVDHVSALWADGDVFAGRLLGITIQIQTGARATGEVGTASSTDVPLGTVQLTGTLRAYFQDSTFYKKLIDNEKTDLGLVFQMPGAANTENYYVIDLPRLKFSEGTVVAGGIDQDVVAEMQYTAYLHETQAFSFGFSKIDNF